MLRRRILYRKKQIVDYNPDYSADNLVFTGSNYVDIGIKLCDYKVVLVVADAANSTVRLR